jgi:SAM-dependent methyltransferase
MTNKEALIEKHFFRPDWYSVFLNPYFIDRYKIYQAIKLFAQKTNGEAKILDVGCGSKPYKKLFANNHYVGLEIRGGGHADKDKQADIFYDGEVFPLTDSSFDAILCTQVIQHVLNTEKLISESSRVLKNGGEILITAPFLYPEHETPFDFRRLTRFGFKKILEENGFTDIKISETTGFFGAVGQLFTILIFESLHFRASILKTLLSIMILGPIQIISLFLDNLTFKTGKKGYTLGYVVMATKKR